ncbi:MAG: cadherin repeat domain-containing protein [Saprospiraceae bacterium]|nr:cadherin repeat domain-containing protein [Candidatus Vicinibacter affinis]
MTQSPLSDATGISDGGTFTITVTATDGATPANSSSCTVTVTVNDNDAPTFTCPSNLTVNTNNSANCEVTVPDVLTGIIDEADNCSAVTMTQSPLSGTAQTGISDGGTFTITVRPDGAHRLIRQLYSNGDGERNAFVS